MKMTKANIFYMINELSQWNYDKEIMLGILRD